MTVGSQMPELDQGAFLPPPSPPPPPPNKGLLLAKGIDQPHHIYLVRV